MLTTGTYISQSHIRGALAFVVSCLRRYVSVFADSVRQEFVRGDQAVMLDWATNLKLLGHALTPLECLVKLEVNQLRGHSATDDGVDVDHTAYFLNVKECFDIAGRAFHIEEPRIAIDQARGRLDGARQVLTQWQNELMVGNEEDAVIALKGLRATIAAAQVCPSEEYILNEIHDAEKRLRAWMSELSHYSGDRVPRNRVEYRCCLAARTHYLMVQLATFFALVAFPALWTAEQHDDALKLHEQVLCNMRLNDARDSQLKRIANLAELDLNALVMDILVEMS